MMAMVIKMSAWRNRDRPSEGATRNNHILHNKLNMNSTCSGIAEIAAGLIRSFSGVRVHFPYFLPLNGKPEYFKMTGVLLRLS